MTKSLEKVGEVTHYFRKISVAVVDVTAPIKLGDKIAVKGMTTNFEQTVKSMQIEMKDIDEAKPGDDIGMKVVDRVRKGDIVYKLLE
ncbi:MAG: translation elongation factor-like protein [Candidatus Bathyarchaeota archaeon]|nr:MAG: translation elongation factor-like protein [Candidatus Bathyarchaeota archaeon]